MLRFVQQHTRTQQFLSLLITPALLFISSLLLVGCGGSSSDSDPSPPINDGTLRGLTVSFSTPERLQDIGTALSATVTASDIEQSMQDMGTGFESTLQLPGDQQLQVFVRISRSEDNLLLAAADATVWIADTGTSVRIPEQRFVYNFDQDSDGINNLLEIERGSSPTDPDSGDIDVNTDTDNDGTPDYLDAFPNNPWESSDADGDGIGDNDDEDDDNDGIKDHRVGSQIVIPYVDNASINIDGIWTEYYDDQNQFYFDEWNKATDSDSYGYGLELGQLMVDNTGRYDDVDYIYPDNYSQFMMMHDGTYLYVRLDIYGEELENWFNDSVDAWMDDSIELYFDVGYDQSDSYGDNDYQRIFRFRDTDPEPTIDGPNSAIGMQTDYATSYRYENDVSYVYEQFYEIRVSLSSIGLEPGATFGFEMAFNDDDDGGERDYKWGWWSPSRIDEAWLRPSAFGKAKLQPID